MLAGKYRAQKTLQGHKNSDLTETVIIYMGGDVLVDEKIIEKILARFNHDRRIKKKPLEVKATYHSAGSDGGYTGLQLISKHRSTDMNCSVMDWQRRFTEFVAYFIREQHLEAQQLVHYKFDGTTESL